MFKMTCICDNCEKVGSLSGSNLYDDDRPRGWSAITIGKERRGRRVRNPPRALHVCSWACLVAIVEKRKLSSRGMEVYALTALN